MTETQSKRAKQIYEEVIENMCSNDTRLSGYVLELYCMLLSDNQKLKTCPVCGSTKDKIEKPLTPNELKTLISTRKIRVKDIAISLGREQNIISRVLSGQLTSAKIKSDIEDYIIRSIEQWNKQQML